MKQKTPHTQIDCASIGEDHLPPPQASVLAGEKICSACRCRKPLNEFYKKRDDYESFCKACKKLKRKPKEHAEAVQAASPSPKLDPPGLIEPESNSQILPESDTSYALWEKRYGRPLTQLEKAEIKHNLTGFFEILVSEYEKMK